MAEETLSEALSNLNDEQIDKAALPENKRVEEDVSEESTYVELTEEETQSAERPAIPSLPASQRTDSFDEVDLCLSEEAAIREAKRCLRCDLQTEDAKEQLLQLEVH